MKDEIVKDHRVAFVGLGGLSDGLRPFFEFFPLFAVARYFKTRHLLSD